MPAVKISNTAIITTELNNYLMSNDYFENQETAATDERIKNEWAIKFQDSIIRDLKSRFDNIEVDITSAEFELVSEDFQGGCLFFLQATITDILKKEFIKIIIKIIVNHHRTRVYLDSEYANTLKWQGKSKVLKTIFKKLKQADKKPGYFDPIPMDELIKKISFFNIINMVVPL